MKLADGFFEEEIAARLGMKTAAVKTSLHRTRKHLLQKLKEEGM